MTRHRSHSTSACLSFTYLTRYHSPTFIPHTPPPVSLSACLSVCLSARYLKHHMSKRDSIFSVHITSDDNATSCLLLVLRTTPCSHTMIPIEHIQLTPHKFPACSPRSQPRCLTLSSNTDSDSKSPDRLVYASFRKPCHIINI